MDVLVHHGTKMEVHLIGIDCFCPVPTVDLTTHPAVD